MFRLELVSELKPKNEPKLYWAEYSHRAGKLLIETAFWFGALPLKFKLHDPIKIQYVRSEFHKTRCKICISLICAIFLTTSADLLHDTINSDILHIQEKRKNYTFRSATVMLSFCFALFYVHTFWKFKSLYSFLNRCIGYYEQFQGK